MKTCQHCITMPMVPLSNILKLICTRLRLLKGRRRLCVLLVTFLICFFFVTIFSRSSRSKGVPVRVQPPNDIRQLSISAEDRQQLLYRDTTILLVMIHSSGNAKGHDRRNAARNTWVSNLSLKQVLNKFGTHVIYKFVLGGKGVPEEAIEKLTLESKQNNDMVILDDIPDDHESLTQRTLSSFLHVPTDKIRRLKPQYVLKCDDDTYVNLVAVVHRLVTRKTRGRLYWGEFVGGYPVLTDGPYAEHDWHVCDLYLPYAYGGGYLLSWDLMDLITDNAQYLVQYGNEDVTLSVWLAPYNVERIHDQGFDTGSDSKGCLWPFIVAHKISVNDTYKYYESLRRYGRICGEMQKSGEVWWARHMYNWTVLPSLCCEVLNGRYYF